MHIEYVCQKYNRSNKRKLRCLQDNGSSFLPGPHSVFVYQRNCTGHCYLYCLYAPRRFLLVEELVEVWMKINVVLETFY